MYLSNYFGGRLLTRPVLILALESVSCSLSNSYNLLVSANCYLASCADEMFSVFIACRACPVTKLRSIIYWKLNNLIAALSIIMTDMSEGEASTSGPADPRARKRPSGTTSSGETDSSKKRCADNGSGSTSSGETDSLDKNYPDYGELASVCTQHRRGGEYFLWILWFV